MAIRFVENNNKIDMELYEEFKDDIFILSPDLLFKKWGACKYYRYRKWCAEEGIFLNGFSKAQYYYYETRSNKWIVYHNRIYYGSYVTEEEAKERVEELKKTGWNKNKLVKNYSKTNNGKYIVRKTVNGVNNYYGTFNSLADVEWAVSFLEENNWSKDKLLEVLI